MFEGVSADMCVGKFLLMSMGGRAESLVWADPVARSPIGVNGNFIEVTTLCIHIFAISLLQLPSLTVKKMDILYKTGFAFCVMADVCYYTFPQLK